MATKKELEERIAQLEAEVALLRARPVAPVGPIQVDPRWHPYGWPQVWCTTESGPAVASPYTINCSSVDEALDVLRR